MAASITIPIPGILLMSKNEKRIRRNNNQTATHIARQTIGPARKENFVIQGNLTRGCAGPQ
jgi:hypothetical protein